jgi:hypothetical protein
MRIGTEYEVAVMVVAVGGICAVHCMEHLQRYWVWLRLVLEFLLARLYGDSLR